MSPSSSNPRNPGRVAMLSAQAFQSLWDLIPTAETAIPPIVSMLSFPTTSFSCVLSFVPTLVDTWTLPVGASGSSPATPPSESYLALAATSNSSLVILDVADDERNIRLYRRRLFSVQGGSRTLASSHPGPHCSEHF